MFTSRIVKNKKLTYEQMSDEQIDVVKQNIEIKKKEAIRIHEDAKVLLDKILAEYDEIMIAIANSREKPPLPRYNSNHTGMD